MAWKIRASADAAPQLPEPLRPIPVGRFCGYVAPWGVKPGSELSVHVSAPGAYDLSVRRLGRRALLDPSLGVDADRAEAEELAAHRFERSANHAVHPGSYGLLRGAWLPRPGTVSVWLRLWRLATVDEDWWWSSLVADFDYPKSCSWALIVDPAGAPGLYVGDGGPYSPDRWCFSTQSLGERIGEWVHVAATLEDSLARIYVDGKPAGEAEVASLPGRVAETLRVGAAAEGGVADHLLDADLSSLLLTSASLPAAQIQALADDRGVTGPEELSIPDVQAFWPFDEQSGTWLRDRSGHGRDLSLVNGATLGIPGPASSPMAGHPGYDPSKDPLRGGAVRFSSDDLLDCRWPAAAQVSVPDDAPSGMYSVSVTPAGADPSEAYEIPFSVVRTKPRHPRSVALLVPLFTWIAYGRQPTNDLVFPGLSSSFYSQHLNGRMFFHVGMRIPLPKIRPHRTISHRPSEALHDQLVAPERYAEAWLDREGYRYECVTDLELHREPDLLERYAALMIVGHNEYWTQEMRDAVDSYLCAGGNVACLAGDVLTWRVAVDEETMAVEGRKAIGFPLEASEDALRARREDQPVPISIQIDDHGWVRLLSDVGGALTDWGERWHTDGEPGGMWPLLGRPANEVLGLETLGHIDCGDEASFAPYQVRDQQHFLFHEPEEVPVGADQTIGTKSLNGSAVSGFEMSGIPEAVVGHEPPETTEGRALLAHAHGQHYVGTFALDPLYGADVIYWERPRGGRVFNAGSIGYTGSLAVDDGIQALTRNVLHHFGVAREGS